jgi:hypothetical protein
MPLPKTNTAQHMVWGVNNESSARSCAWRDACLQITLIEAHAPSRKDVSASHTLNRDAYSGGFAPVACWLLWIMVLVGAQPTGEEWSGRERGRCGQLNDVGLFLTVRAWSTTLSLWLCCACSLDLLESAARRPCEVRTHKRNATTTAAPNESRVSSAFCNLSAFFRLHVLFGYKFC